MVSCYECFSFGGLCLFLLTVLVWFCVGSYWLFELRFGCLILFELLVHSCWFGGGECLIFLLWFCFTICLVCFRVYCLIVGIIADCGCCVCLCCAWLLLIDGLACSSTLIGAGVWSVFAVSLFYWLLNSVVCILWFVHFVLFSFWVCVILLLVCVWLLIRFGYCLLNVCEWFVYD